MRIKKLLSTMLSISLLLMAAVVPAWAAEPGSEGKDLTITATDCNVRITLSDSEDGLFSYDYDSSIYEVTTQTDESGTAIQITRKSGMSTFIDIVKIQVPNALYNQVNVTANSSGVSLPAFSANLSISADKSAISAVIPAGYSKTCSYQATGSSGCLVFQEDATNYKYSMQVNGCAVSLPSSWTKYPNYGPYTYQSGDATGIIDVDIEGCSFAVTAA